MIIPAIVQDIKKPPHGYLSLGNIKDPDTNFPGRADLLSEATHYFFTYKDYLIIVSDSKTIRLQTRDVLRGGYYQACFPMEALPWVVKMLDYFFTPPKDGGLPAGKIAAKDIVAGETLMFDRGICVGSPHYGGYTLTNLSRVNYGEEANSKSFQKFNFPDPFLFEGGLLEFWKDLADRHERGEFNRFQ